MSNIYLFFVRVKMILKFLFYDDMDVTYTFSHTKNDKTVDKRVVIKKETIDDNN